MYFIKPQQTEKPGPEEFSVLPFTLIGLPILVLIPKKFEAKAWKPFNSDDLPVKTILFVTMGHLEEIKIAIRMAAVYKTKWLSIILNNE